MKLILRKHCNSKKKNPSINQCEQQGEDGRYRFGIFLVLDDFDVTLIRQAENTYHSKKR